MQEPWEPLASQKEASKISMMQRSKQSRTALELIQRRLWSKQSNFLSLWKIFLTWTRSPRQMLLWSCTKWRNKARDLSSKGLARPSVSTIISILNSSRALRSITCLKKHRHFWSKRMIWTILIKPITSRLKNTLDLSNFSSIRLSQVSTKHSSKRFSTRQGHRVGSQK